ncbi:MAG: restriction endonuclease subunit S [Pseudomonadota bacterium]
MGWQTFKVKDVCSVEKEKLGKDKLPYVGMEDIESGTGRFLGDLLPKSVASSTFKFSDKHVLYGRLRPYLNKVLVPNFEGHCSSEIFPLKPVHNLDRSFLAYWLRSERVVSAINRTCTGARMPRANVKELLEFDIDIPSIDEQRRIVAILDEAFADIDKARALTELNLENARELFESYLSQVFGRTEMNVEKVSLGKASGGVQTGPFGSLLHKSDYIDGGIPLINPAHITSIGIEPDNKKTVSLETKERLKSYILSQGDVVIGRRGEMGRCATVTEKEDGFLCGTGSFFIKSSEHIFSPYLVRLLRSNIGKNKLEKLAGGAVMPNLSNAQLSKLEVPLPSFDVQRKIADEIDILSDNLEKVSTIYFQKSVKLEELKKSLLQKAFTGELTRVAG